MGNFNKGDRFGGNKRFNNDRGGNRGGRPQMHHAVCADCGKDCEVPFRPSGDKPVYCSDCFGGKDSQRGGRNERRSFDRSDSREKKMFKAVCDKCGKDCEVPFRPTGDKPVYCSECFGKGEKKGSSQKSFGSNDNKKQFEMLNTKLDNILEMLSGKTTAKKIVKKEKPIAKPAKKTVKKKAAPKKTVKKAAPKKKAATPKKKVVKKTKKK